MSKSNNVDMHVIEREGSSRRETIGMNCYIQPYACIYACMEAHTFPNISQYNIYSHVIMSRTYNFGSHA